MLTQVEVPGRELGTKRWEAAMGLRTKKDLFTLVQRLQAEKLKPQTNERALYDPALEREINAGQSQAVHKKAS